MDIFKQIQLKLKYFFGSLFYLSFTPKAFLYSLKRDLIERQFTHLSTEGDFDKPGKLLRAEPIARGANFYFELAELEIYFLTEDLVRINWKPGISPIPYGIAQHEWQEVETQLEQSDTNFSVSSRELKVIIEVDGSIKFCVSSGGTIREEMPPQRKNQGWIHQTKLRQEEHIYGLGERASSLNLRAAKDEQQQSKTYRMWNYDAAGKYAPGSDPMYLCIPVYLSLHFSGSYLIFYENSFDANFTFAETATAEFSGGALRYYFTIGSPPQLLERYTELTGRSPLPARWALGYHQSKWGYRTEQAIREEAKVFQSHNLPLSAIHLDIDCQVGNRAFTIDPESFSQVSEFYTRTCRNGSTIYCDSQPWN